MSQAQTYWVFDWSKITTLEDVITLLRAMDPTPHPQHPNFDEIRPYCKEIDSDGRAVAGSSQPGG